MKRMIGAALALALMAGAVLCVSPGVVSGQTAAGNSAQDAAAQYQQQVDDYAKRMKRSDDLMKSQEESQRRGAALMAKQEELIKRQEENLVRYEKILEGWEKQQKQYQKYLDGLGKK